MESKDKTLAHISTSQMDRFETCEVQWDYIYNKGIKMAPGFAMMQGSSFHVAEQKNFQQKIKKGKDLKLSVVKDILSEDFTERVRQRKATIVNNKIMVSEKEAAIKPNDAKNQALASLAKFHETVAPAVIPTEAEKEGQIMINGLGKPAALKYVMDLVGKPIQEVRRGIFRTVNKGTAILDWKLTGRQMAATELERSYQYPAYIGAYQSIHKKLPDQFALLATIKTQKPTVQILSTKPRADKINWLMDRIARVFPAMEDIRSGRRLPRPAALHPSFLSPCKPTSCGLWGICKVRPH